jgi:hypothetical protein
VRGSKIYVLIILHSNVACVHHIAHEGGVGWGGLGLGFHHPNSVWSSHAKRSIHDMVRMKENETSFLETG